jgi:hypothetical protein
VNFGAISGLQVELGAALTADGNVTLEAAGLMLEKRASFFSLSSDVNGNPVIGRPIVGAVSGGEAVELVSFTPPFQFQGTIAVASTSQLQGLELNVCCNGLRDLGGLDLLVGFRTLDLYETLTIQEEFVDTTGVTIGGQGGAGLTFLGQPVPAGVPISTQDRIRTTNLFYGPQLGARWEREFGRWGVDVTGKVAVGYTRETVSIEGNSVLQTPGAPQNAPGGVLAQVTNIGAHAQWQHAVVPEFKINFRCQITSWLQAQIGYSFLFWSNTDRPGDAIDRTINRFLVPTDQLFGTATGPARPQFQFHQSDFWAQGFNAGLLIQY